MKTLIIVGDYTITPSTGKIQYTVDIFGQTPEEPKAVFINAVTFDVTTYNQFIDECKAVYCNYFNTDLNNIITIDRLYNKNHHG